MSQGREREQVFTAPLVLGAAVFVLALAFVEKGLNLIGTSLPVLTVWPRQLLDWAVVLLTLDIALSLRQLLENRLFETAPEPPGEFTS